MDHTIGGQGVFIGDDGLPVDGEHVPAAAHLQRSALQGLHGQPRDNGFGTHGRFQDVVLQQVWGPNRTQASQCRSRLTGAGGVHPARGCENSVLTNADLQTGVPGGPDPPLLLSAVHLNLAGALWMDCLNLNPSSAIYQL